MLRIEGNITHQSPNSHLILNLDLPFDGLQNLQKTKHLLFTTESEGEWVYS